MTDYNKFSSSAFGGGTGAGATLNKIPVSPYGVATVEVIGNAVFRNDVVVLGNIINSGVSGPTGSVNFNNLNITDNLTVGNQLGVTGPTELYTTLNVGGTATFIGPVGITGDCSIYGNQYTNNTNVGGNLGVTGITTLYSNTNIGGILGVTGNTNLYGTLYVNGNAEFNNQVKTDILTSTASATATYIQPTGDLFLYNGGGLIPSRPSNNIFMNSSFNIAIDAGNNITNNLDGDFTVNNGVANKGLIVKNSLSTASSNIIFKDSINVETGFIKSYPSSAGAIQDTLDISAKSGTMRLFSNNIISNAPLSIISSVTSPILEFKNTSGSGTKRIMFRDSSDIESLNIQSSGTISEIDSYVPLTFTTSGIGSYMNFNSSNNMGFDTQNNCNFISRAGSISVESQGGPIIFDNSGVTGSASGDMTIKSGNNTLLQSVGKMNIKTTSTTLGDVFVEPANNRNINLKTIGTGYISLESADDIRIANPIRPSYNPSVISSTAQIGYQVSFSSTTAPVVNTAVNVVFNGSSSFTLPLGVWIVEFYSGWAQQSNNRAISISTTSATLDTQRAQYSTQQNTSYQQLNLTTVIVSTNASTPYYAVTYCGGNSGGFNNTQQHYIRRTRIA